MRFKKGGWPVTFQGDPGLCNHLISLKAMLKAIKGEGEAILLELYSLVSSNQIPQGLTVLKPPTLLMKFANICTEPETLPPVRACDHAFVL